MGSRPSRVLSGALGRPYLEECHFADDGIVHALRQGPAASCPEAAPSALTHLQMRPCKGQRHAQALPSHTVPSPHCTGWAPGVPIPLPPESPRLGGYALCLQAFAHAVPSAGNNSPAFHNPTHASEPSTHVTSSRKPSLDILPPSYYVISPCPIARITPLVQLLADDLSSPLTL